MAELPVRDHLLEKLWICAASCEYCADKCQEENKPELLDCIRSCRDCSEISVLSARFVARDSEFAGKVLEVCASLCSRCIGHCSSNTASYAEICQKDCIKCLDACHAYMQGLISP